MLIRTRFKGKRSLLRMHWYRFPEVLSEIALGLQTSQSHSCTKNLGIECIIPVVRQLRL
jgi:hypothetical protein